jgi:hypothetical protein
MSLKNWFLKYVICVVKCQNSKGRCTLLHNLTEIFNFVMSFQDQYISQVYELENECNALKRSVF